MTDLPEELKLVLTFFGGTGDLAKRKLYPSVFNLYKKGYLQEHFAIIGTARQEMSDKEFKDLVKDSIEDFANDFSEQEIDKFISHFYYIAHDVTNIDSYEPLKALVEDLDQKYTTDGNRIFYMSVAPRFFGMIAKSLKSEGLLSTNGYNRLMIEKPFGTSFQTAQQLQNELEEAFNDDQLYRIDHYLGKEMVQNIAAIRFGNPFFDNTWNHNYIKNIQVTLSETLGVEGRADYYDTAGALLDMIQNHTMQIIGWLAMEKPDSFSDVDIRNAKNKAFSSLRIYKGKDEVSQNFVRGQYVGRKSAELNYNQEAGVAENTQTNTFIAGKLEFNNETWKGVPFYIRSGKKLAEKTTRIDVVFKPTAFNFGGNAGLQGYPVLTIIVDPYGSIKLQLNAKAVTDNFFLRKINLDWNVSEQDKTDSPEPYERMIHDTMNGDGSNFADWNGVATSWKFIDEIVKVYDENQAPLELYKSGTMGPDASDELLEKNGDAWVLQGNHRKTIDANL
ncbi:MAG: glucose-6-phosphate dehydrogenase [Lactobacillaceae bacterium]|jgi:glucose-6-phosphate 1-dehydrogenase|nr:glucose-6-phosphate dehydrogenase [Lactobacillaceae bacterium]